MARRTVSKQAVAQLIHDVVRKAVDEWEEQGVDNRGLDMKLYYIKPGARKRVGDLKVSARDPKRGWKLAADMRFCHHWTRADAERFVYSRVRRLPFLRGPIAA